MSKRNAYADEEIAYAKVNLALHVRRRLENGYHELETVFAFLDHGDELFVTPSDNLKLDIEGPFSSRLSTDNNLVLQAAKSLRSSCGSNLGAHLHLVKNLPIASGIGGGSADAAATLRLLNRFWKLGLSTEELIEIARPMGADIPACIRSKTCFGSGIGQDLVPLSSADVSKYSVVLVNPKIPVSTPEIFGRWDGLDRGQLDTGKMHDILTEGRNDLQEPAIRLVPIVETILKQLWETKPFTAKMSGSGATCFAVYETTKLASAALKHIQQVAPEYWTMTGKVR